MKGLSRKQLTNVARLTDDLEVPAGTVLCRQGTRGQEFFVIVDGEATVTRGNKAVATIGSGDFFGEIALLEHVVRTATVTARDTAALLRRQRSCLPAPCSLDTDPNIERKVCAARRSRGGCVSNSGDPEVASPR